MKKKNLIFFVIAIVMVSAYFMALHFLEKEDLNQPPVITVDSDTITISVKDDKTALLQGVSAVDEEDGDLSDEIVIDLLSPFNSDLQRTVTYAVFDNNNHVAKATRTMTYSDYQNPQFYFKGPMIGSSVSTSNITNSLGAISSVDGDITRRISIQTTYQSDNKTIITKANVSDSTGTNASLEFTYYIDDHEYNIDIGLKDYLVYLHKGDAFDPKSNIDIVKLNQTNNEELIDTVIITGDYDLNTPGTYEINYTADYYGDHGRTQCLIVVQ